MSRTKAISEKCKECIYDPNQSGSWRTQVTNCTCASCPLYEYRPKNSNKIFTNEEK